MARILKVNARTRTNQKARSNLVFCAFSFGILEVERRPWWSKEYSVLTTHQQVIDLGHSQVTPGDFMIPIILGFEP